MTYIYETLSTHEIAHALRKDDNARWSYDGALALAEWLEQYAEDTGEPIELDIVALRCEFSEWESAIDISINYADSPQRDDPDYDDDDEHHKAVIDWLNENTIVVLDNDDCIIFQDF